MTDERMPTASGKRRRGLNAASVEPRRASGQVAGLRAGALLALAHDWRFMRADRGYFCLPEIDARIPFRPGMTALLRSRLAPDTLRDVVLTGSRYGGDEAAARGVVTQAVSGDWDALIDAACEQARAQAGKDRATMAALKRDLYQEPFTLLQG